MQKPSGQERHNGQEVAECLIRQHHPFFGWLYSKGKADCKHKQSVFPFSSMQCTHKTS